MILHDEFFPLPLECHKIEWKNVETPSMTFLRDALLSCLEECYWDLLPLYGPDFPSFFHNSLPFIELTCHSHYNFFVQLVSKWVFWNDKQRALSIFFCRIQFWMEEERPSFTHEETFRWKGLLILTLFSLHFLGMFSYPSGASKKRKYRE